jgi:hypothetical protein
LSQARGSNPPKPPDLERLRNMSAQESKRELAKEDRGPRISRQQRQENLRKKANERSREFFWQKAALGATEEQWKLIKPKLEKVRQLRAQGRQGGSMVGIFLAGGSSSSGTRPRAGARQNVPTWQWKRSWRDKAPGELTEAQKLTDQLIALVESKYTTQEQFRRTINALRKARREEAEGKTQLQLSEAREELRKVLTTRQEAALVLMRWL